MSLRLFLAECAGATVRQELALRLVSLQLKYAPWRDALLEVYKQHSSRCPGVRGCCRQRANFMLDLLLEVCLRMDGVTCDAWHRNVSHRLWFTSGPALYLTRLHIFASSPQVWPAAPLPEERLHSEALVPQPNGSCGRHRPTRTPDSCC